MIIKYVNSSSESIDLNRAGVKLREANFFKKVWKTEKNNEKYNCVKEPIEYKMTLEVIGSKSFKKEKLNEITELMEKDIISSQKGKLYLGDWYLNCNITESKTYPAESPIGMISEMYIFAEDAIWVKELTKQFLPQSVASTDDLDFPFDFPFDFAPEQAGIAKWSVDHYASSNFQMIIYGPCTDPKILINGYPYQIHTELEASDYLVIDSQKNTVTKYLASGTTANLYNSRDFKNRVFEKIPSGDLTLNWSGSFGFDITLYLERSEPKWGTDDSRKNLITEAGAYLVTE